jgi:type II secretion system protein J
MNSARPSPSAAPRLAAGFTLIELLLALSIMSMILAAMSGVLYLAFRMHTNMTATLEESMPVEQALLSIQRDLSCIVCNNTSNNVMLIGSFQTINLTNKLVGQEGPDFYTTGGEPDGMVPWGDIQKVNYLLANSTNRSLNGRDLVRAVTRNLLPINGAPTTPDRRKVILSGVQSLTFYYYDGMTWENNWDTTQQTNLPFGIKMAIQMSPQANSRVAPKLYELYIPVSVQMSTNLTAALQ